MIRIVKHNHSIQLMREIAEIALNKQVYKELGYPVYSDINHTWYLAYNTCQKRYVKDKLIGFCAVIDKGNNYSFNHDYLLPEFRGKGIYQELFRGRLIDFDNNIKAVATKMSVNTFIRYGFNINKQTKNYTFVSK